MCIDICLQFTIYNVYNIRFISTFVDKETAPMLKNEKHIIKYLLRLF